MSTKQSFINITGVTRMNLGFFILFLFCFRVCYSIVTKNESHYFDETPQGSIKNFSVELRLPTECETPNLDPGYCIEIQDCPILLKQLKNINATNFLKASRCGPKNEDYSRPKVCCGKYDNFKHLIVDDKTIFPKRCGVEKISVHNRIIGGTEANIGEFPWMARLIHKNDRGFKSVGCAGFLIHSKYVLTAAHCVNPEFTRIRGPVFSVLLGEHNTETKIDCADNGKYCADPLQISRVAKIIAHPGYDDKTTGHYNDIALIHLKKGARFTDFVQPICLQIDNEEYVPGRYAISGWGKTKTVQFSKIKMKLEIPPFNKGNCIDQFRSVNIDVVETQICAGGESDMDGCSGDSGGPLMFDNGTNWFAAGIVSFGISCGLEGWPGVYTNIPSFVPWIKEEIIKNSANTKNSNNTESYKTKNRTITTKTVQSVAVDQVFNIVIMFYKICFCVVFFAAISDNFQAKGQWQTRKRRPQYAHSNMSQRGRECKTPNQEWATCESIYTCQRLLNTIQNKDPIQVRFLRQSQCGYDSEPLVCCGTKSTYMRRNTQNGGTAIPGRSLIGSRNRDGIVGVAKGGASNYNYRSNSVLPQRPSCGQDFSEKIYGGIRTQLNEFPWMALLQYANGTGFKRWACAGTLINNRYILTAAHCVTGEITKKVGLLVNVRLGEYDTAHDVDCDGALCNSPQDIGVEEAVYNQGYDNDDTQRYNDIALIRLNKSVKFSSFIQPLCLPNINEAAAIGERVVVAGWGKTESSGRSSKKLKVEIPIAQRRQCTTAFSSAGINLENSQICAGGERGKDSCSGDSGGPLMKTVKGDVSTWYLEGIVSFGAKCGTEGWPGIYTRVENYLGWIHSNVRP
ncbi:uncharacterized protein LOC130441829 [Diorhabda sublineata]|uniref:uncharacterized protein LOC130441829 n=1 Tax=Diorhabda sublineata TaxID=1163346 RepID=UPI0024E1504D|nr:uncharacterized protein LOC130441829 [Diorhabda sublineata]